MEREMPPFRCIIHCAAGIQDSSLVNMTEANFDNVLRPKIAGAWNLHQKTLDQELDFFVMYSSATTLFGNEGQGNYVAANLYLESWPTIGEDSAYPGWRLPGGRLARWDTWRGTPSSHGCSESGSAGSCSHRHWRSTGWSKRSRLG